MWRLYCPRCGWRGEAEAYVHRCPRCGGPLEVEGVLPRPRSSILGEGDTPLVWDGENLYKLEYLNPTGSFKDRGASLSVWLAHGLGYKCVVDDSSGNTGIAVAAYAGHLGLKARIHVYRGAAPGKVTLIRRLGAEIVVHDSREEAARGAEAEAENCYYVAHAVSPVFIEGVSSLGEELANHISEGPVYVPVSSGSLLLGLYRGARRRGVRPRIIAVQSPEAPSLLGRTQLLARVGGGSGRLLDALVLRSPPRLDEMAEAVEGLVIAGDEAVEEALESLYRRGFIVEPSSAVVEAAARAVGEAGLLVLTGSGLKYAGGEPG